MENQEVLLQKGQINLEFLSKNTILAAFEI